MNFPSKEIDPDAKAAGKSAEDLFRIECHQIFPLEDISQSPGLDFEQYGDRKLKFKRGDKIVRAEGLHDVEIEIKCRELHKAGSPDAYLWLDKNQRDRHLAMAQKIGARVIFAFYERDGAVARPGSLRMISLKKIARWNAQETKNGLAISIRISQMTPGLELLYKLQNKKSDLNRNQFSRQDFYNNQNQTWYNKSKVSLETSKDLAHVSSSPPSQTDLKQYKINWRATIRAIFLGCSILLTATIGIFTAWLVKTAGSIPSAYTQLIQKIKYEILAHRVSEEQMLWLKIGGFLGGVMILIGGLIITIGSCRLINRILGYESEKFRPISLAMTLSTLLVITLCIVAFQMQSNGVTGWTFVLAASALIIAFMLKKSWHRGRGIFAVLINFVFVGFLPTLCWFSINKGLWKPEGRKIWSFKKIEIRPAIRVR